MPALNIGNTVRRVAADAFQSVSSAVRRAGSDGSREAVLAHAVSIGRSAAEDARLSKNGEFSKLRIAGAALRPSRTFRRLAMGALKASAADALAVARTCRRAGRR